MLSDYEKDLLENQDGPLEGVNLFDSIWSQERELAELFVKFCETHRPAIYIDWKNGLTERQKEHYFVEMVAALEFGTRDMGETIDAFLEWLEEPMQSRATQSLKEALETEDEPLVRRPKASAAIDDDHAESRRLRRAIDGLLSTYIAGEPFKADQIKELTDAYLALENPGLKPRDHKAYLKDIKKIAEAAEPKRADVYATVYSLHFNFPHHAPLLREFKRWISDPNRKAQEIWNGVESDWQERLLGLHPEDRKDALAALRRALKDEKFSEKLESLTQKMLHTEA